MKITAIAAISKDGSIGDGEKMLWHLPGDLAFFRRCTLGHVVAMGRRTFESIGKPLEGRFNVVLSQSGFRHPSCLVLRDVGELLALDAKTVFVIGGGEIYAQTMKFWDEIVLTRIDCDLTGSAKFPLPKPSRKQWQRVGLTTFPADERNVFARQIEIYKRVQ